MSIGVFFIYVKTLLAHSPNTFIFFRCILPAQIFKAHSPDLIKYFRHILRIKKDAQMGIDNL
jgi:hypothetical protein